MKQPATNRQSRKIRSCLFMECFSFVLFINTTQYLLFVSTRTTYYTHRRRVATGLSHHWAKSVLGCIAPALHRAAVGCGYEVPQRSLPCRRCRAAGIRGGAYTHAIGAHPQFQRLVIHTHAQSLLAAASQQNIHRWRRAH